MLGYILIALGAIAIAYAVGYSVYRWFVTATTKGMTAFENSTIVMWGRIFKGVGGAITIASQTGTQAVNNATDLVAQNADILTSPNTQGLMEKIFHSIFSDAYVGIAIGLCGVLIEICQHKEVAKLPPGSPSQPAPING